MPAGPLLPRGVSLAWAISGVGVGEPGIRAMDAKMNILLVDDQPAKLLTYQAMLAQLGENLIPAHSGMEALELLLKNDIALVLMDVCMPGMDGFETAPSPAAVARAPSRFPARFRCGCVARNLRYNSARRKANPASSSKGGLLPDAERTEDQVQNVIRRRGARNLVQGTEGVIKIHQQHLVGHLACDGIVRGIQRR